MKLRNYRGSDAYMTATSRTIRQLFSDDIADFTAFDATLDAAYLAAWLTKIEAAETVVRDSTLLDIQVQLTTQVNGLMQTSRDKYYDVRYFVKKAFPKNIEVLNEFGANDFRRDSRSQPRMVQFLDGLHKAADKYKTQLISKGLLQTEIDEILTLRTSLSDSNTAQEAMKRGRPVLTDDRIEVLNTCYDATKTVIDAAQRVYKDDEAKRNAYRYDDTGSGNNSNELTFSGTITDNVTGALLQDAEIEADGEVIATTNALGQFSITFTIEEPVTVNLTVTKEGYNPYNTPQSFTPGVNETQNINMGRIVLAVYQQTVGAGAHSFGAFMANATGLRITLLEGTAATVGLSNNGMSFVGNTETVDTIDEVIDRTLAELGGYASQVLVQNNSAGNVEVKVEVLG